MPRVVKHPDVRRAELVLAAQALFFERGYDATSVDDIIKRSSVSKGAFYYYFPSKEAVLEAMARQMAEAAVLELQDVVNDPCLNAFEQLNLLFRHSRSAKVDQAAEILSYFAAVFRPENLALYHRIHAAVNGVMIPILTDIIGRGVAEKSLLSDEPAITAEIILGLVSTTHRSVAGLFEASTEEEFRVAADEFERRWHAQGIAMDRILGLPDGSLEVVEPGFADALFRQWRQKYHRS